MKTFHTFKEDLEKSLAPLKKLGQNFSKDAKKFANSKEAENLKNDVLNMFIDKGQKLLNKGSDKLTDIKKNVK